MLAIGAVLAGYLNWPDYEGRHISLGEFLQKSPSILMSFVRTGGLHPPTQFGLPETPDTAVETQMHALHVSMMLSSGLIALLGIYLAYLFHLKYRDRGEAMAARHPLAVRVLEAKYWVDEIYQAAVVEPLRAIGRVFFAIDRYVVDGIVSGVGYVPQVAGFTLKLTTQRGSLQGYALLMLLGIAIILLFLFL